MNTITRYLTQSEQQRLIATISQHAAVRAQRDCASVCLLQNTGLRVTEFLLIDVGCARAALIEGRLFIPREHRKGKARDHDVLVTSKVRDALTRLLRISAQMAGCALEHLPDDAPLVISRQGGRLSKRAFNQALKMWGRAAGLPKRFSAHWLRHTRAMNIMRESTHRDPRGVVQSALAHADIRSTGIYTQLSREEVDAELRAIDAPPRLRKRDLRRSFENRRHIDQRPA